MLKVGDFLFVKKAKQAPHRRHAEIEFKGWAIVMLVATLDTFEQPPAQEHLWVLLGRAGLINFDDVAEFLGPEAAKNCVAKFADKYHGKRLEEPVPTPTLLDASGDAVHKALVGKPTLVDPTNETPPLSPLYVAINDSVARDKAVLAGKFQSKETLESLANDASLTESIPRSVAASMAQELLKRRVAETLFRENTMAAVIALINTGGHETITDFERRALLSQEKPA